MLGELAPLGLWKMGQITGRAVRLGHDHDYSPNTIIYGQVDRSQSLAILCNSCSVNSQLATIPTVSLETNVPVFSRMLVVSSVL